MMAEEYADAERLAAEALGPGWTPWMKLSLIDSDPNSAGATEPVATVYTLCRGAKRTTEHSVFLRRMPDGRIMRAGSYLPLLSELLLERHPTHTIVVHGQRVPAPRYTLCWSSLQGSKPSSPGPSPQPR